MSLSVFVLVVLSVVLPSALCEYCGDGYYCNEGYCCGSLNRSCCSSTYGSGTWGGIATSVVVIIIIICIIVCCCNHNCWCYQRYRGGDVIMAPAAPANTVTVVNSSSHQMVPQPYPVASPQFSPPQGYAQPGYPQPPPAQGYAQPPQPMQGPPEYTNKGYMSN